jgi:hypothetical protein
MDNWLIFQSFYNGLEPGAILMLLLEGLSSLSHR